MTPRIVHHRPAPRQYPRRRWLEIERDYYLSRLQDVLAALAAESSADFVSASASASASASGASAGAQ